MRSPTWLCAAFALVGFIGCSDELKVSGVEPAQGSFGGGEDVVIKGNGFKPGRGGVTIKFGARDATSVVVASGDKIKAMTPGGDPNTTVDVTVVFDDGKAFKVANGFHYMPPIEQRQTLDKAFNAMGSGDNKAKAPPPSPAPPPPQAPPPPNPTK
jgi:hypothetical protein